MPCYCGRAFLAFQNVPGLGLRRVQSLAISFFTRLAATACPPPSLTRAFRVSSRANLRAHRFAYAFMVFAPEIEPINPDPGRIGPITRSWIGPPDLGIGVGVPIPVPKIGRASCRE